jgi:hypothetical protein
MTYEVSQAIEQMVQFESEYLRLSGMVAAASATNQPALTETYAWERRQNADMQEAYDTYISEAFDAFTAVFIRGRARAIVMHRTAA